MPMGKLYLASRAGTGRPAKRKTKPKTKKVGGGLILFRTSRPRAGYFPITNIQPRDKVVKLRYAINQGDVHAITSTSGSIVQYAYSCNGMYDPYLGGGGNQPRGFDQLMTMYRHYTVLFSKINLDFVFTNESTSNPMKVGVYIRDTATAYTMSQDIAEAPRTRQAVVTDDVTPVKVKMGFNCRKMFRVKDVTDDNELRGTSSTNPSQVAAWNVFGYAFNGFTETVWFSGYIDYIAVLTHRIQPTAS